MTTPTRIKGGKIRVLLDLASSASYEAPCGFTGRSLTISKNLQEYNLPDCDDPDAISWVGRDAASLSMSISGQGVLASESVETWLDAAERVEPVATKIEIEFPSKTITWTGLMQVGSAEIGGDNGVTATLNVSLQSDGQMARVVS
jgi:hypothetical protein